MMNRALRWGLMLLVAGALGAVFLSYFNPHLVADLANRVWSCF